MNTYEKWIENYIFLHEPRGKCAEATAEMIKEFPELKRVRGHVRHILGSKLSPHWWCIDTNGIIIDPTAVQFVAIIEYIPHDETQSEPTGRCPNCGEYCYNYDFACSDKCAEQYRAYVESSITDTFMKS